MKYTRVLKPTLKKIFLWLILLIATGFITYLIPFTDVPFSFGFPFPFYRFGGHTMTGLFVHPQFDIIFFIIDAILWYLVSCFVWMKKEVM